MLFTSHLPLFSTQTPVAVEDVFEGVAENVPHAAEAPKELKKIKSWSEKVTNPLVSEGFLPTYAQYYCPLFQKYSLFLRSQ